MENISTGSFCNDSSCAFFRQNSMIYDETVLRGNRNFFSFKYISC